MMHLMDNLVKRLENNQPVVEAVICEHSGSTPRSTGADMIIAEDGSFDGSIGGGIMEAEAQRKAAALFSLPADSAELMSFDLSSTQAALNDMICGGRLQVFMQLIHPSADTVGIYTAAANALKKGHKVVVLCSLGSADAKAPLHVTGRWVIVQGTTSLDVPEELEKRALAAANAGGAAIFTWEGTRYLASPHLENGTIVLVGAGHVAQHTAAAAARVGFNVTVIDDRGEFANSQRFPDATQIVVLDTFDNCFSGVQIDANSYVIIVTRGHVHDKTVLGQILRSSPGYLGMIGSRRKRDAIYDALEEEGYSREEFTRVHCPIGLPIKAETPEELAVSIVGELIKFRAERRGSRKK